MEKIVISVDVYSIEIYFYKTVPEVFSEPLIYLLKSYDYYIYTALCEYSIVKNNFDGIKKYMIEYIEDNYIGFYDTFNKEFLEEKKNHIMKDIISYLEDEKENLEVYIANEHFSNEKEKDSIKKRMIKQLEKEEDILTKFIMECIHKEKDNIKKHIMDFIDE